MRALSCALALVGLVGGGGSAAAGKVSLPMESARASWQRPGFRLALGLGYGRLVGLSGAPSGRLLGPLLRVGARLDARWSLAGSFQYLSASESGGLSGLRFAGTLEPTLHFGRWSVALGLGFGGLVEGRTGRRDATPPASTLETSLTLADADPPLARCQGVGVAALLRVDWMWIVSARTATGLSLEGSGQWTGCEDDSGRIDPDTAEPIVRRQWWPHVGVTLGWQVAWR